MEIEKRWIEKFEEVKKQFDCKTDLEKYFTQDKIGNIKIDKINIGEVNFPTGKVFTCDPLVELGEAKPFIQTIPVGNYNTIICVVPHEKYGDRYACVKTEISSNKPVRYELGMIGTENLNEEYEEGTFFGFGVDAGMGCIADIKSQDEFNQYWNQIKKEHPENNFIDPYNNLFEDLLKENYNKSPKYQRPGGDWINWKIPNTDCNIPIFASGWGDGCYPTYFGYDQNGNITGVYIWFINIEKDYINEK